MCSAQTYRWGGSAAVAVPGGVGVPNADWKISEYTPYTCVGIHWMVNQKKGISFSLPVASEHMLRGASSITLNNSWIILFIRGCLGIKIKRSIDLDRAVRAIVPFYFNQLTLFEQIAINYRFIKAVCCKSLTRAQEALTKGAVNAVYYGALSWSKVGRNSKDRTARQQVLPRSKWSRCGTFIFHNVHTDTD